MSSISAQQSLLPKDLQASLYRAGSDHLAARCAANHQRGDRRICLVDLHTGTRDFNRQFVRNAAAVGQLQTQGHDLITHLGEDVSFVLPGRSRWQRYRCGAIAEIPGDHVHARGQCSGNLTVEPQRFTADALRAASNRQDRQRREFDTDLHRAGVAQSTGIGNDDRYGVLPRIRIRI